MRLLQSAIVIASMSTHLRAKRKVRRFRRADPVAWFRIPARALAVVRLSDAARFGDSGGFYWFEIKDAIDDLYASQSIDEREYRLLRNVLVSPERAVLCAQAFTKLVLSLGWNVAREVRSYSRKMREARIKVRDFVRFIRDYDGDV